jgi:hypothetical protein
MKSDETKAKRLGDHRGRVRQLRLAPLSDPRNSFAALGTPRLKTTLLSDECTCFSSFHFVENYQRALMRSRRNGGRARAREDERKNVGRGWRTEDVQSLSAVAAAAAGTMAIENGK